MVLQIKETGLDCDGGYWRRFSELRSLFSLDEKCRMWRSLMSENELLEKWRIIKKDSIKDVYKLIRRLKANFKDYDWPLMKGSKVWRGAGENLCNTWNSSVEERGRTSDHGPNRCVGIRRKFYKKLFPLGNDVQTLQIHSIKQQALSVLVSEMRNMASKWRTEKDDILLIKNNAQKINETLQEFKWRSVEVGTNINVAKTKVLCSACMLKVNFRLIASTWQSSAIRFTYT